MNTQMEAINDIGELGEETAEAHAVSLSSEEQARLEEMIRAGIIYGRKKSKTNPKMAKYIFAMRKGIEIFDLIQTLQLLDKAAAFLKEKYLKKAAVLVVGTQSAAKEPVKGFSEKFGFLSVTERWLGGTLTNFRVIAKRIEYFTKLKSDRAAGRLEKYTKKERMKLDEKIAKLSKVLSGIEQMNQLPEAIFVVDIEEHRTAVREANRLKIPIIGIANTDGDPDGIDYLIPANDNARTSVQWIFDYLAKKMASQESAVVQ